MPTGKKPREEKMKQQKNLPVREFIDFEDGIAVLGYALSEKEALKLIHQRELKIYGVSKDELMPDEDLRPIYKISMVEKNFDRQYNLKFTPEQEGDYIIGYELSV